MKKNVKSEERVIECCWQEWHAAQMETRVGVFCFPFLCPLQSWNYTSYGASLSPALWKHVQKWRYESGGLFFRGRPRRVTSRTTRTEGNRLTPLLCVRSHYAGRCTGPRGVMVGSESPASKPLVRSAQLAFETESPTPYSKRGWKKIPIRLLRKGRDARARTYTWPFLSFFY